MYLMMRNFPSRIGVRWNSTRLHNIVSAKIGVKRFRSSSVRDEMSSTANDMMKEDIRKSGLSQDEGLLPFDSRRNSETFGQWVRADSFYRNNQLNKASGDEKVKIIDSEGKSPYRNADGTYIKGSSADEARLHDWTLEGRVDRSVTKIPAEIAATINDSILIFTIPDKLREKAALIFQSITKEQMQKAPETSLECDAYIAALFAQDYSHVRQVLLELQNRVGAKNFNPRRVLDVGYGPATGIAALNEIMGDDYSPEVKDAYIIGRKNHEMKKRAKIILSRQLNEIPEESEIPEPSQSAVQKEKEGIPGDQKEQKDQDESEEEEVLSEQIDASKVKIRTKLRDSLPVTKQYDLIIVNQALLTKKHQFIRDIDQNVFLLLKLLSPKGHILFVERGNALGFETIARARQVMIRPEAYPHENGKIPRPYIKGSTYKPQKLRREDQIITTSDIEFEEKLLKKLELDNFEEEVKKEFGDVSQEDLKFEFEDDDNYIVKPVGNEESDKKLGESNSTMDLIDYHISILAPCPHHGKCPLQLGDPKYYQIPSHKHRLNMCSFSKILERPKYTMELKKGRRLAVPWNTFAEDGFGLDKLSKKERKTLEGSGRPGGRNTETGSYSYLIAERAPNDNATIQSILKDREYTQSGVPDPQSPNNWPRIVLNPTKVKNNVKLTVCAPSARIETWQVPKSLGKQVYHDARKATRGDLWALLKKSVQVRNHISDKAKEKLQYLAKAHKKKFIKEESKKQWKKLVSSSEQAFEDPAYELADSLATSLENSKKYKTKGKRAGYSVDPSLYDAK